MAQYLKEEVRTAIEGAALKVFAERGYMDAKMSDIAAQSGLSSGNLYRYFANKEDLFHTIVDRAFAADFLKLLRKRVRSLRGKVLSDGSLKAQSIANELLVFWLEHRLKAIIILSGARGSAYEDFRSRVIHELSRMTFAYIEKVEPSLLGNLRTRDAKLLLNVIFENTINAIVTILSSTDDPAIITRRLEAFWAYQIAGLNALLTNALAQNETRSTHNIQPSKRRHAHKEIEAT